VSAGAPFDRATAVAVTERSTVTLPRSTKDTRSAL
jgi:hypothetical protein